MGMMQAVAQDPLRLGGPGELPDGLRLPYFVLELDGDGNVVSASGGYFDLTDEELLQTLTGSARAGTPASWRTTACASAGLSPARSAWSLLTCPAKRASWKTWCATVSS